MKNASQKVRSDENLEVHMPFVIFTCVTGKMHLYSANQTCVIFSYILLQLKDNLVLSTESELIM